MTLFKHHDRLPTGQALIEEATRLGVSLEGLPSRSYYKKEADPENEAEIQSRVFAARAEHRSAAISRIQSVGIIGSLLLTLGLALWNGHLQSQRESADKMIKFSEMLDLGGSGDMGVELDMDRNLDHSK